MTDPTRPDWIRPGAPVVLYNTGGANRDRNVVEALGVPGWLPDGAPVTLSAPGDRVRITQTVPLTELPDGAL